MNPVTSGADRADLAAELVVDNLDLIARFTATPTGETDDHRRHRSGPRFTVDLTPESVTFGPSNDTGAVDGLDVPRRRARYRW